MRSRPANKAGSVWRSGAPNFFSLYFFHVNILEKRATNKGPTISAQVEEKKCFATEYYPQRDRIFDSGFVVREERVEA